MGTCGSNKQIIENRANRIMTQRIFNMGKPSATWELKLTGPSSENFSTIKVVLQYFFFSLYEDNTQSHPRNTMSL